MRIARKSKAKAKAKKTDIQNTNTKEVVTAKANSISPKGSIDAAPNSREVIDENECTLYLLM